MGKFRNGKGMKKNILTAVNILVILGLAGVAGFFYQKSQDLNKKYNDVQAKYTEITKDPKAVQAVEIRRYIEEVGKVYDLPKDEEPSVATVSDKDKLKDQAFFNKAENGDVTLIYSKAKLAILYRPSTKQLVNVSTVTIQQDAKDPAPASTPTPVAQ